MQGPTVNRELLDAAMAWVEQEAAKPKSESKWYQARWSIPGREIGRECGTAYCIAGYVASTLGEVKRFSVSVNGRTEMISRAAQKALGLTNDEAEELFWYQNDIVDVRDVVGQIRKRAEAAS